MFRVLLLILTCMAGFSSNLYAVESSNNRLAMLITQANSGNADAQNNLGAFYCKPEGSNVDCSEAVKWYSKAAEQGHSLAQSNLGGLYAEGRGVLKDYIIAYKWFNLAAAQNNYHAIKSRDVIEKSMTAEQIAEGQRLSREWLVRIGQ